jgi:hypothetical protein
MTEPHMNATIALRRPDGGRFTDDDVAGLMPRTLLVVEVTARAGDGVTDSADGEIATVVTLGSVIGWIPPAQAAFGRTMLTGACTAVHAAADQLTRPQPPPGATGKHHAPADTPAAGQ